MCSPNMLIKVQLAMALGPIKEKELTSAGPS